MWSDSRMTVPVAFNRARKTIRVTAARREFFCARITHIARI